jgi:hypothetical protein
MPDTLHPLMAQWIRELGLAEFRLWVDEPPDVLDPAIWHRDQAAAVCTYVERLVDGRVLACRALGQGDAAGECWCVGHRAWGRWTAHE